MRSTVNADAVVFSAGAIVRVGARTSPVTSASLNTDLAAATAVGLLGADVSFNIEQTVRQKMDRFPEVVVAEAMQAQNASAELVLREWTNANLMLALGLETADVTAVAASPGPPPVEAHQEMQIGRRATVVYRIVMITEHLTNGRRYEAIFWRARLGARGALQLNSVDQGADIPLIVQATFEPVNNTLVTLRNYS